MRRCVLKYATWFTEDYFLVQASYRLVAKKKKKHLAHLKLVAN